MTSKYDRVRGTGAARLIAAALLGVLVLPGPVAWALVKCVYWSAVWDLRLVSLEALEATDSEAPDIPDVPQGGTLWVKGLSSTTYFGDIVLAGMGATWTIDVNSVADSKDQPDAQ